MKVMVSLGALQELRFHEYLIRFVAGGIITVAAGLIAKRFGPSFGGLFLAFPAILPASATMIAKHKRLRKEEKGLRGTIRGRKAAGADAAGAALGGIGLIVFAILVWRMLPHLSAWAALTSATAAWFGVAYGAWKIYKAI
jgi:uncharacterized protein DUF3147